MRTLLNLLLLLATGLLAALLAARIGNYPAVSPEPVPALELKDVKLPVAPEPQGATPEAPVQKQTTPKAAPQKEPQQSPPTQAETPAPTPAPAVAPTPFITPQLTDQQLYERLAGSIVQIFCTGREELFSASGVIVNERGLVLTNAHVAAIVQRLGEDSCQARHGNPADTFAKVEVVFVAHTSEKIPNTNVSQRDIAFLRLVNPTSPFQVADGGFTNATGGETLLTLGYPSEFLQSITASVNSSLVFSTVRVDGFADLDGDTKTAESYIFHGGLALQQGSSGTAVFTRAGEVAGLIFATTKGETTAARDGLAFTMSYIDKILHLETGEGFVAFIESH